MVTSVSDLILLLCLIGSIVFGLYCAILDILETISMIGDIYYDYRGK